MAWRKILELDPELFELALGRDPLSPLTPARRIFVNRHLRLDSINHVGFDLDYTLAVYRKRPFEIAQFRLTQKRLVEAHGYPVELLQVGYRPASVLRGLVVDKRHGNLLKMDAHDHVARASHGNHIIDRDRRHKIYRRRRIRLSAARYASLDSQFSIPEGALYASLVEFFDDRAQRGLDLHPVAEPDGKVSYQKLFVDVRESIDTIHRDDTLKSLICDNLAGFIERDRELAPALLKLRATGKRLFLLTNSNWKYTDAVMRYLLDSELDDHPRWRDYFDLVVVDATKPDFFTQRRPFLVLDPDGMPRGTVSRGRLPSENVYAQGNIRDFERLTGAYGDQVLYVGDHIYGDILRSKKDSLWRTALITPELEEELERQYLDHRDFEQLAELDRQRQRLDDELNDLKSVISRLQTSLATFGTSARHPHLGSLELRALDEGLQKLRAHVDDRTRELEDVDNRADWLRRGIDTRFNPTWGRVYKEGNELSRYGAQVEDYACIYTSRVTNFAYYSPLHYFRAPLDLMAHERAEPLER